MSRPGRWWSRDRGLPPEVYRTWTASVVAVPGRPARVLAWARTADGVAIGSPAVISIDDTDGWTHVGWHEIERGGWDHGSRAISWTTYAGERASLVLSDPGRLPELFRERVAASIVVEKFVAVPGSRAQSDRGVVVNGRRNLAETDEPISWHASLGPGTSWAIPGLREVADRAISDLRAEYDPGWVG